MCTAESPNRQNTCDRCTFNRIASLAVRWSWTEDRDMCSVQVLLNAKLAFCQVHARQRRSVCYTAVAVTHAKHVHKCSTMPMQLGLEATQATCGMLTIEACWTGACLSARCVRDLPVNNGAALLK